MKALLLLITLLPVVSPADEVSKAISSPEDALELKVEVAHLDIHLLVVPNTHHVAKGDEVQLDVFIVNDGMNPIKCPRSMENEDGYSGAGRTLHTNYFGYENGELLRTGGGSDARMILDAGQSVIARRSSKRFRFKWQCTNADFDLITLDVEILVEGKMRRGTVTLLPKQQVGTGQPATRPESKTEGGDKPQQEAEGRSQ